MGSEMKEQRDVGERSGYQAVYFSLAYSREGNIIGGDTEREETMQMIRQASKRNSGLRPWGRALGIAVFGLAFAVSQAWAVPYKGTATGFFSGTLFDLDGDGFGALLGSTSGFSSPGGDNMCSLIQEAAFVPTPTGACGPAEVEYMVLPETTRLDCQYRGSGDVFNFRVTGTICLPFSCFGADFNETFRLQEGCTGIAEGTMTLLGGNGRAQGASGSFTYKQTAIYTKLDFPYAGILSSEIKGDITLAAGNAFPGEAEIDQTLMDAVTAGDVDAVRVALDEGASVHGRGADGETPLFIAASPEMAQLLLNAGASVHARNAYGMTPLHDASILGRVEIVQLLLDAGAAVYAQDSHGRTPLDWLENSPLGHLAPKANDAIIQMLKDAGGE